MSSVIHQDQKTQITSTRNEKSDILIHSISISIE